MMWPQAKECRGLPIAVAAGRGQEGLSPRDFGERVALPTPWFWPPELWRNTFLLFKPHRLWQFAMATLSTVLYHWSFELWCWRRPLRVPGTARWSIQSILKETNHDYSLEGLMLKLQYFGHLMGRANSLEKTLALGRIEGRGAGDDRGWNGWMASLTQWTWVWVNSGR